MTIVCGTDFSQPARDAVAVAAKLSCRLKQDLVLVHAVAPHAADPMGFDFEPLRAAMAGALEHEAAEMRSAGLKVATRAVIGWPEEEIVQTAREAGADLIVMGALGRHQGLYWLIGSVAERVAQTTPVPLLLVLSTVAIGTKPPRHMRHRESDLGDSKYDDGASLRPFR